MPLRVVRFLTWPSRRDSSRNAMMINTAAKPPETNETNFAIIEMIGEGNCFRYSDACTTLLFIRCLNKWSTCCRCKKLRKRHHIYFERRKSEYFKSLTRINYVHKNIHSTLERMKARWEKLPHWIPWRATLTNWTIFEKMQYLDDCRTVQHALGIDTPA